MAKIILNTNTASRNFYVERKVLESSTIEDVVELLVTPKSGLTINAENLTVGYLPEQVDKIEYVNSGKNVIAKVYLNLPSNEDIVNDRDIVILLPISGTTTSSTDVFKLMVTSTVNENVIVNDFSIFPKSTKGNDVVYSINCGVDKKTLLLSKTFGTVNGDYFTQEPTVNIVGNASRYKVISKSTKNKHGEIIYNTIEVYYNSPKDVININRTDKISFTASANRTRRMLKKKPVNYDGILVDQKDFKIYSIDTGRTVGKIGGTQKITVKGVPGTPFSIISSNTASETYDFETGIFSNTGNAMIKGVIPPAVGGVAFGVSNLNIRIPSTSTINTIKTSLISNESIDHSLLAQGHSSPNVTIEDTTAPESSMTVSVLQDDFSGRTLNNNTDYVIGPGHLGSLDANTHTISFNVYGDAAGSRLKIIRQPKHSQTEEFVNWDSGSTGTKLKN